MKPEPKMFHTLGVALRHARKADKAKKRTAASLASAIRLYEGGPFLSRASIAMYETGQRNVPLYTLEKIEAVLEVKFVEYETVFGHHHPKCAVTAAPGGYVKMSPPGGDKTQRPPRNVTGRSTGDKKTGIRSA